MNLLSLILLFSFISCSTIHVKSNDQTTITFDKIKSHKEKIQIKVEKEYFLWGLFPQHDIYVDQELKAKGFEKVSSLEISKVRETKDLIWTLVTFGVYMPQTYHINAMRN